MSRRAGTSERPPEACTPCLRRAWLLAALSGPLDFLAGDRQRLIETLSLGDERLIEALGGRRRTELKAQHARFEPGRLSPAGDIEAVCRHSASFPCDACGACAPRLLFTTAGASRLERLSRAPVVAIVGSRRASDYGIEMAKGVARGLAAAGVTVTSGLGDGIAWAAQAGALEAQAGTIAVVHDGLGVGFSRPRRQLCRRVRLGGCLVSELPWDCRGRRWGAPASERIVAALAELTVVVEAEDSPRELAVARVAQALGKRVAALPGPVTSSRSSGTHALLLEGAPLIRDARDVLDLLHSAAGRAARAAATQAEPLPLTPSLRRTLERVGSGCDTPEKLAQGGDIEEALLALTELELMGLLARGDGGRYLPRTAPPGPSWPATLEGRPVQQSEER